MKSIPLRTEGDLAWADAIVQIIRRPLDPQKGADIPELRRGIRILDALDASNGTLELEDADYAELKAKTLAMPWAMVDRRVLQLVEDITGADN